MPVSAPLLATQAAFDVRRSSQTMPLLLQRGCLLMRRCLPGPQNSALPPPQGWRRLQVVWQERFGEPLLVGLGDHMQLGLFSIRWGPDWNRPSSFSFIHEDCPQLELCSQLLPSELAQPEPSWQWDAAGDRAPRELLLGQRSCAGSAQQSAGARPQC
ncbi:unnamed protein product [Polarella glacialis]|uniref:Uncharacterized protein n=1 Tax=Polarella glacialis TaxID=89957 RepID=A0A813LHS2_POLGL|nr:unnamed protein product [Polarella glacialis]